MDKLFDEITDEISGEMAKHHGWERTLRHGTSFALHQWWGRTTASLARVATYLALTDSRLIDNAFLIALSDPLVGEELLSAARTKIEEGVIAKNMGRGQDGDAA